MSTSQVLLHPDRVKQIGNNNKFRRGDQRRSDKRMVYPENSVLVSEWEEPDRPYSQRELQTLKQQYFKHNQLSPELYVEHVECGHVYHVKEGGNKHKQLVQNPTHNDLGNCSVCWKRSKTPRELWEAADEFESMFRANFANPRETFLNLQVLKIFYTWLYSEEYL